MGFWCDLICRRRYPSPYEPLRYIPDDELAEPGESDERTVEPPEASPKNAVHDTEIPALHVTEPLRRMSDMR